MREAIAAAAAMTVEDKTIAANMIQSMTSNTREWDVKHTRINIKMTMKKIGNIISECNITPTPIGLNVCVDRIEETYYFGNILQWLDDTESL